MEIKKRSRICLCTEFELENSEKFHQNIVEFIKKKEFVDKTEKIEKDMFSFHKKELLPPIGFDIDINVRSLDGIKKRNQEIITELESQKVNINSEKELEKINNRIKYYKEIPKEIEDKFKTPKCSMKYECTLIENAELTNLYEYFNQSNFREILKKIDDSNDSNFNAIMCSFLRISNDINMLQDKNFRFRRKIDLNKEFTDEIGELYLTSIEFEVQKSSLGIEEIEFIERKNYKGLNFKIKFTNKTISNLRDNLDLINNVLKLFIVED